jgi:pullulanase/glycogen debranching enzyme
VKLPTLLQSWYLYSFKLVFAEKLLSLVTNRARHAPQVMSSSQHHIQAAYWIRPGQACVLLSRNWKRNTLPPITLQGKDLQLQNLRPMDPEEIGRFTGYYESQDSIIFCLNPERYPHIDFDQDPVRAAGPFNDWGRSADAASYELTEASPPNGKPFYQVKVPRHQVVKAGKKMTFKFVTRSWHWLTPLRCAANLAEDKSGNLNYVLNVSRSGRHAFTFDLKSGRGMDQAAQVVWNAETPTPIRPGLFFYDLESRYKCGLTFANDAATFRLFAPRATRVCIEIFQTLENPQPQRYDLSLSNDQVTWEVAVSGYLHGWFYRYFIDGPDDGCTTHFDFTQAVLDPYAQATAGPEGPGIILDPQKTAKPNPPHDPPPWQDLSILECHVRDLTQKAPIELNETERLGFAGVTRLLEQDASYVRTLGVNTLEFQPIQQFDSTDRDTYHWGYMTNAYFAPCAWYGTAPSKASQNHEFSEMVRTCHDQDLSVIIDVVYNHVGEPPNLLYIDKAYYFHLDETGEHINWSGCGNTLRAESAMARRLIIESLCHLVETYGVDGFRFDLAELISIEVLKEIGDALRTLKPSIILIAEPWSFRGSIQWDTRMAGYSFWNDGFREFAREYVLGHSNGGALAYYAKGCLDHMAAWPSQSINYVESHDDRCWLDQITEHSDHNGTHPTHNDILRSHMMAALLYTSIGIPLLSCGQDFMRSKGGLNNTYQRGDVNALNYQRIQSYGRTHDYFKQWIAFRQSALAKVLRLNQNPGEAYLRCFNCDQSDASATALLFNADRSQGSTQILLALNPHFEAHKIHLYDVDGDHWRALADIENFNVHGILDERLQRDERSIYLGPMNLGLWVRQ